MRTTGRSSHGRLYLSGAVLCFLFATAGSASAAITVASSQPEAFVRGGLYIEGTDEDSDIQIERSDVVVSPYSDSLSVSDTGAGVLATDGCIAGESSTVLYCARYWPRAMVFLYGGQDTLVGKANLAYSVGGAEGADSLTTAGEPDGLLGGPGNDVLVARGGDDVLRGDEGHDGLFGGAGDDRLFAIDGQRDRVISCGSGQDVAYVDRRLDPRTRGCEKVGYALPPGR